MELSRKKREELVNKAKKDTKLVRREQEKSFETTRKNQVQNAITDMELVSEEDNNDWEDKDDDEVVEAFETDISNARESIIGMFSGKNNSKSNDK